MLVPTTTLHDVHCMTRLVFLVDVTTKYTVCRIREPVVNTNGTQDLKFELVVHLGRLWDSINRPKCAAGSCWRRSAKQWAGSRTNEQTM